MESGEYKRVEHLLADHELKDNERFDEIKNELHEIKLMLEPIHDIYTGSIFTFRGVSGLLKLTAAVGAAVAAIIYLARLR